MSLGVSDGIVVDSFTSLDGADVYVCIGFTPRYVRAADDTNADEVYNVTTTGAIQSYTGGDILIYDEGQTRWELKSDGSDATGVYVDQAGADIAGQFITGTPEDGATIHTPAGFILDAASLIAAGAGDNAVSYLAIR